MENLSDSLLVILFAFIALCLFVLLGGVVYGLVALPFYAIWRLYKRFRGDPTGKRYKCIAYRQNALEGHTALQPVAVGLCPSGHYPAKVAFERVTGKQKKIIKKGCDSLGYQLECKESER